MWLTAVRMFALLMGSASFDPLPGAPWSVGQTAYLEPPLSISAQVAVDGLTNADVLKMVAAKLSEDIILNTIEDAPKKAFDLSTTGLIALRNAGVSDEIIRVMQGRPRTDTRDPESVVPKAPVSERTSNAAPAGESSCAGLVELDKGSGGVGRVGRILGGGVLWGRRKENTESGAPAPTQVKKVNNGEPAVISIPQSETEATTKVKTFLNCRNLDFAVNPDSGRILTDWFDDRRCGPGIQHCANRATIRITSEGGTTVIRIQVIERKREGGMSERPWHENSESRGKETAEFAAELEAFLRFRGA